MIREDQGLKHKDGEMILPELRRYNLDLIAMLLMEEILHQLIGIPHPRYYYLPLSYVDSGITSHFSKHQQSWSKPMVFKTSASQR